MAQLPKSIRERIDRSTWPCFALGKITSRQDISKVKQWIKLNVSGPSYVRLIQETVGNRRMTIGTFVRIRDEDDATFFKIAWFSSQ